MAIPAKNRRNAQKVIDGIRERAKAGRERAKILRGDEAEQELALVQIDEREADRMQRSLDKMVMDNF